MSDTRAALGDLEACLAALEKKKGQIHPQTYALMVEPIKEDIDRLREQIKEEVGKHE